MYLATSPAHSFNEAVISLHSDSQSSKCAGRPTLTEKWSQNGSVTWPMQTENYLGQEESLVKITALGGHTHLPYIQTHCLVAYIYKLATCQRVIVNMVINSMRKTVHFWDAAGSNPIHSWFAGHTLCSHPDSWVQALVVFLTTSQNGSNVFDSSTTSW